jgi:GTPase
MGIGTVLGGMLKKGIAKTGEEYLLGPFRDGTYQKVKVRSIHVKRTLVNEVDSGRYVCFATPKVDRSSIEKGMVLLDKNASLVSVRMFKAEVIVFKTHHTTIKIGYNTIMNINSLRTAVELVDVVSKTKVSLKKSIEKIPAENEKDDKLLSLGDRAFVVLKAKYRPCYFCVGDRFSMSEGQMKITGIIRELLP